MRKYVMPEEVMIYQPGSRKRTQNGLDKLRDAMMDNILAIDMQWNAPDKCPLRFLGPYGRPFESVGRLEFFRWRRRRFVC